MDASFFTALALLIFLGILGYAGVHKFILAAWMPAAPRLRPSWARPSACATRLPRC